MQQRRDMSHPCEDCPIEDKLYECCGRHPETGAVAGLQLPDGRMVAACPHLSPAGDCLIYPCRPYGCRRHQCSRFDPVPVESAGCYRLAALWGPAGQ